MNRFLIAAAALAAAASPAAAVTVSNPALIIIPDAGEVTSTISVAGVSGNITGLSLTLNGLSHTYPDDLVLGLVNQSLGLGLVFMSFSGGSTDINNVTLTFSDAAAGQLPQSFIDAAAITSGTYLPSNFGGYGIAFFDDAISFSDFYGTSANGDWTLYVDDVFPADTGSILNGWSLDFTTVGGTVPEPASWALMLGGFGLVGGALRRRSREAIPA